MSNPFRMLVRMWGRKSRPIVKAPPRARLGIERFEDRVVPTISGDFVGLQDTLQSFLSTADDALTTVRDVTEAKLPIVDKSFKDLVGLDNSLENIITELQQTITAIQQISSPNTLESEVEGVITQYLGENGANILTADPEVTLPTSKNDAALNVKLQLGKVVTSPTYQFGLGLDSLPFNVTTDTTGDLTLEAGFKLANLEFGLSKDGTPFLKPLEGVQLFAQAALEDFTFDANIGFLALQAATNKDAKGDNPNALFVKLDIPIVDMQGQDASQLFSSPTLTGGANLDLLLSGGFSGAQVTAPSVKSNFILDWEFSDSQAKQTDSTFGNKLDIAFNKVEVDFGTYLTKMLQPVIEKIQEYVEPFKDFFHTLGEPIPVLSDIAKVVGDNDGVSLLDIASIASNTGLIPADYAVYVTLAQKVVQITNIINQIQADPSVNLGNMYLTVGDFDLTGNQTAQGGPDVRDLGSAEDAGYGDVTDLDWSNLSSIASSIQVNVLKDEITKAFGPNNELGNLLNDAIDDLQSTLANPQHPNKASITFATPVIDHPADAVFGLLSGKNTDLVTFEADAHLEVASSIPIFSYSGFEITIGGAIDFDAFLKIGYDTYGLRQVLDNVINNQVNIDDVLPDLANGFYIHPNTHLTIGGKLEISGGVNYTLASAHVTGYLEAGIDVSMPKYADLNNDGVIDTNTEAVDQDGDGVVRPNEFHPHLFDVAGYIAGGLDLEFKLGIDPLSVSHSIHLASGEIASFDTGATNPFDHKGLQPATYDAGTGKLTLNIGGYYSNRNYPTFDAIVNENVLVTHADKQNGDKAGEAVYVTMFGVTKRYDGVKSIYAEADESNALAGNDTITIGEKVTVPVTIYGGGGSDVLKNNGSGTTIFYGDEGNDRLSGGSGKATFYGGSGDDMLEADTGDATFFGDGDNDQLTGGIGINVLHGGGGDDVIQGGDGKNTLYGDGGNDQLTGGIVNGEMLDGGDGNDLITIGTGQTQAFGGTGDDQFEWTLAPGNGGVEIDAGSGRDQVFLYGTKGDDVFSVSKLANSFPYVVQVAANAGVPNANIFVKLAGVEDIDVEAGEGADAITVNDVTSAGVLSVSVNLQDIVKSHYGIGDKATDTIIVNGRNVADNVTLKTEQVTAQYPEHRGMLPVLGGVTTITGLPEYTVRVANVTDNAGSVIVSDSLTFRALDGDDKVNVWGITGPTTIRGNGNPFPGGSDNDTITVIALTDQDFSTELKVEADGGTNALNAYEATTTGSAFTVTQQRIEGPLLKAVNFTATGGNYQGGVALWTGDGHDTILVKNTLPNTITSINSGAGNDVVQLSSAATGGVASDILGTVSLDLGAGLSNTLKLSDTAAASGNANVIISTDKVTGFVGPTDNTQVNFKATGGDLTLLLEGSTGPQVENYTVNNPAAILQLEGNGGDDTVDVLNMSRPGTVNGGIGNDVVRVGYGTNKLDGITGALNVIGGSGNDTVTLYDTAAGTGHDYGIDTTTITRNGSGGVSFDTTLETLTVQATNLNDNFTLIHAPVAGKVNLNANGGNDKLYGPNVDMNWQIQMQNGGTVSNNISFRDTENLYGGTGTDRFQSANTTGAGVIGAINGGGGIDKLDYSAVNANITIDLQTKSATNVGSFDGIEEFLGGVAVDELIAPNLPNIFQVQGTNSGQVATMAQGTFKFTNVESLRGGTFSDSFEFAPTGNLTGGLRGEGGIDTLDYSQLPTAGGVYVNLGTGTAAKVSGAVQTVENVNGSAGDDILIGNTLSNVLNGGEGRDILIGGEGADNLNGGNGEDILIGGKTSYDSNQLAMSLIKAEWSSAGSFTTRRQHILGAAGGANGNIFLDDNKVPNDNAPDQVIGGNASADWFWTNANDATSDFTAAQGDKYRTN